MNPGKSATRSHKSEFKTTNSDEKASPFDQIKQLEEHEEMRVKKIQEELFVEEQQALKAMEQSELHQEEKLRQEARDELRAYKEELSSLITEGEKNIRREKQELEEQYKQHAPALQEELLQTLRTGKILSSAA